VEPGEVAKFHDALAVAIGKGDLDAQIVTLQTEVDGLRNSR